MNQIITQKFLSKKLFSMI